MTMTWKPDVPAHIASLVPYPPGKPIEETKREYGIDHVVKLASNENPLGPSPRATAAIANAVKELQLYPDGSHYKLKAAIAKKFNLALNELSVGNGSNEFIDILLRVYVQKGCNVVAQEKAFVAYKLCAQLQGCDYVEAKVDSDFRVSAESLLAACTEKTKMVVLANPNNPTGTWMAKEELEDLASKLNSRKILLVLDYAYWEYVTEKSIPDPIELFRKFENVIVLKTFSKIYGLAGLRVGYLVARPEVTAMVERARQPFNVNSLALEAAVAALDDEEFLNRAVKTNNEGLHQLVEGLKKYDVDVFPKKRKSGELPQGNFLLVDFKASSQILYPEFLRRGVIIRPVSNYGLPTFFRISSGLKEENEMFLKAMKEISAAGLIGSL